MGKIIESKIERFDGGIINDPRNPASNTARIISNFDVITSPKKMTPYRSSESGDSNADTARIQNYCLAKSSAGVYNLYGLGRISGANVKVRVYYKTTANGISADLRDSGWTNNAESDGNQVLNYDTDLKLFVYYHNTNRIYGAHTGTHIWEFDPTISSPSAFVNQKYAITYTDITQGVVHTKDDVLYIGTYDSAAGTSQIIKKDGSNAFAVALTLPKQYKPVSLTEYGDFLAIGLASVSGEEGSRTILWDRNSSLATITSNINYGPEELKILEEVNGELISISIKATSTSFFDKVVFKRYAAGDKIDVIKEIVETNISSIGLAVPTAKQKINNRLYFLMAIRLDGAIRDGLWSFGKNKLDEWTLINEQTVNNDTALAVGDSLKAFYVLGDYRFITYVASSVWGLSKTNDAAATYSHNSIYETKIYDGRQADPSVDANFYKDLVEVSVETEYMPAAGQITLAYQVDEDIGTNTWTTIFTNTTNNSISHTANNIESSGATLPRGYKQIAFRILSTGGAEVTGLRWKEDVIGKKYITD